MVRNIRRKRAAARARTRAQDEYRRRVALGEPPLRAAEKLLAPVPDRTLVVIEGGRGNPRRQGAIYVYGRGDRAS